MSKELKEPSATKYTQGFPTSRPAATITRCPRRDVPAAAAGRWHHGRLTWEVWESAEDMRSHELSSLDGDKTTGRRQRNTWCATSTASPAARTTHAPQRAVTGLPKTFEGQSPKRRSVLWSAVRSARTAQLSHIPPDHGKSVNPWRADKLTVLDTLQPDTREKKWGWKRQRPPSQSHHKLLLRCLLCFWVCFVSCTSNQSQKSVCGCKTFLSTHQHWIIKDN